MNGTRIERIEAVFHEVMAAPLAEREGVITRLTEGDEALAMEVRSLVEAAGADDLLERLDTLAESVESWLEHVPERLGRYRVIRAIGEGGWGRVFEAEQDEPLARRVAVKILHPGMNSRSVLQRFRRELDVLARMDHASIAKVFDAGLTEQGLPYIVMEFIDGLRIDTFCEENASDLRERVELLAGVCEAVQHAHTKGIVHRDLKPSNILVVQGEDGPRPVVIDFGIAKALTEDTHGQTTTAGHLHPGTPEYMSPEQASDGGAEIDARTDIYSLGVVLYRLVTGVLPFTAERSAQESGGDLMRLIREHESPPPSVVARTKGERLPREIDWIVRRCLAKRPEDRYETVAALRSDLERFVRREPLEAGPPTARYRVRSFVRRHPVASTVAGAVLFSVLIGGSIASVGFINASSARSAEHARRLEAERTSDFLRRLLLDFEFTELGGSERETLIRMVNRAAASLPEDGGEQPSADLVIRAILRDVFRNLRDFVAAAGQSAKRVEIARATFGDSSPEAIEAELVLFEDYMAADPFAEIDYDQIIDTAPDLAERAMAADPPLARQAMRALALRASCLEKRGRRGEAESEILAILPEARDSLGEHDPLVDQLETLLATCYTSVFRGSDAFEIYEPMLQRHEAIYGPNDSQTMRTRTNLYEAMIMMGRGQEIEAELSGLAKAWHDRNGLDDDWTMWAYAKLGECYDAQNRPDEAITLLVGLLTEFRQRAARGQSTTRLAHCAEALATRLWDGGQEELADAVIADPLGARLPPLRRGNSKEE